MSNITRLETAAARAAKLQNPAQIFFDRRELDQILRIYGRMVAAGEWRDYAMSGTRDQAIFAIFRRASERPLYTLEKTPKLAKRQGAYALKGEQGQILKRGHDLETVLRELDRKSLKIIEND